MQWIRPGAGPGSASSYIHPPSTRTFRPRQAQQVPLHQFTSPLLHQLRIFAFLCMSLVEAVRCPGLRTVSWGCVSKQRI